MADRKKPFRKNSGGVDLKKFVEERDAVLLSLDKDRITAYLEKRRMPVPKNEWTFWAGVHKCIVHMNSATEEQKHYSAMWLLENGFNLEIR